MNPQTQPIYNRPKPQPVPAAPKPKWSEQRDGGDVFLQAAKTPVAVYFGDGETIPSATVKNVAKFTLLLQVEGEDVLVFKHSVKKITAEVRP
jgi:sRNA-binding regulator protein Hfq